MQYRNKKESSKNKKESGKKPEKNPYKIGKTGKNKIRSNT
jgi:hypothetical protein